MNLETADNVLWEIYWPLLKDQYTAPTFFDTSEIIEFKAKLRSKLDSATKEEAQEWLRCAAEAERHAQYEVLKEEFEGDA